MGDTYLLSGGDSTMDHEGFMRGSATDATSVDNLTLRVASLEKKVRRRDLIFGVPAFIALGGVVAGVLLLWRESPEKAATLAGGIASLITVGLTGAIVYFTRQYVVAAQAQLHEFGTQADQELRARIYGCYAEIDLEAIRHDEGAAGNHITLLKNFTARLNGAWRELASTGTPRTREAGMALFREHAFDDETFMSFYSLNKLALIDATIEGMRDAGVRAIEREGFRRAVEPYIGAAVSIPFWCFASGVYEDRFTKLIDDCLEAVHGKDSLPIGGWNRAQIGGKPSPALSRGAGSPGS